MVVFQTLLNATPKALTNIGMHNCYLGVDLRKSDIFSMIFYTNLLLVMSEFWEQV